MDALEPIRILVVDDHPVFVGGVEAMVSAQPGMRVIGRADSVAAAHSFLARNRADVALVDLRLPDGLGTELLVKVPPERLPAVIILSTYKTQQYLQIAMNHGASGFLLKTAPTAEIVSGIRHVATGGVLFTAQELREGHAGWVPLSPRERDVITGVVAGRSNDEIGAEMAISPKTVEFHLARLFERYGVFSRTELAVRAERENWLDLPTRREREPHP